MDSHQGDFLAVGVIQVLVGEQRCLSQEVTYLVVLIAALLLNLLEVIYGIHQLIQVLDAADVLGCIVAQEHALQFRAADCLGRHGHGIAAALVEFDEAVDESGESLELGQCTAVHVQPVLFGMVHHLPQAHAMFGSAMRDLAHSGVADAAGGVVDDASQRLIIIGVDDEPEIADGVFYLLALVERQAAVDAVRDSAAHVAVLVAAAAIAQGFLEHTRLGIGAIQHGIILVTVALTCL